MPDLETDINGHASITMGNVSITNLAGRRILFSHDGRIILRHLLIDREFKIETDEQFNELWASLDKFGRESPGHWPTLRRYWDLYDREDDPENKERRLNDIREYSEKIQDRSSMLDVANEKLNHLAKLDMDIIMKAQAYDELVRHHDNVITVNIENYSELKYEVDRLRDRIKDTLVHLNREWGPIVLKKKVRELLTQ
jgi:hypothetical protein